MKIFPSDVPDFDRARLLTSEALDKAKAIDDAAKRMLKDAAATEYFSDWIQFQINRLEQIDEVLNTNCAQIQPRMKWSDGDLEELDIQVK